MNINRDIYRIVTLIVMCCTLTSIACAQEDCANGIDDDSDGLIDLNDPDCSCLQISADSIIGDFEDANCCPDNWTGSGSNMGIECLNNWSAASFGTPDYFNECDYLGGTPIPDVPLPMPSGNGCVGVFTTSIGMELVGQCLPFSIVPGEVYTVELFVGFNAEVDIESPSPFTFSLYGTTSCANYPVGGFGCMTSEPDWYELATVTVSGSDSTWNYATVMFTATQTIQAIAFGASCSELNGFKYHFIDDLKIYGNYGSEGVDVGQIEQTGDCVSGVELSITEIPGATYQWYLNGIAIFGANSKTYPVPTGDDGIYSVLVDDGQGCGVSDTIEVEIPTNVLDITGEATDVDCYGSATGSIDLDPPGENPPISVQWGTGESTEDIFNLFPGSYSVTVTDANGCSGVQTFFITQPDDPLMVQFAQIVQPVGSGALGSAELSSMGGTPAYTYLWDNGEDTEIATSLEPGIHFVTITDANGCEEVLSVEIHEPLVVDATIVSESCGGYCDGSIEVNVTGGLINYTFAWDNGGVSSFNFALCAGIYSVTITDDAGTIFVDNYEVTAPSEISIDGLYTDLVCPGENGWIELDVTGGTPEYSYIWSNGETEANIYDLNPDEYFVTVTDENGCTGVQNFFIDMIDPIVFTAEITQEGCGGGANGAISITIENGTGPFLYDWSNSLTGQSIDGLISGTYEVTVTDGFGCIESDTFVVSQGGSLDVMIDTEDASCQGVADGAIAIIVSGGTPPYNYLWETGETTPNLNGLAAGNYTITIEDTGGCEYVQVIPVNTGVSIDLSSTATNTKCADSYDGNIDLQVLNGTPPYIFIWSNGAVTEDVDNLGAGGYTVTVTDFNGCNAETTIVINSPVPLELSGVSVAASCSGIMDGSCEVSVSGGIGPYTFIWNTGEMSDKIVGMASGNYSVTVTDANNCSAQGMYTIDALEEIDAVGDITSASCSGGNNGAINVTITGGTAPYTFIWNTGQMTRDIQNLTAGSYSLTITDVNGCNFSTMFEVFGAGGIVVDANVSGIKCFGDNQGEINIDVSGGTVPYMFQWSDGSSSKDLNGLGPGDYTLTVTDVQGCELQVSYTIDDVELLLMSSSEENISCSGEMDGRISLTPSGGTAPYSFMWSSGQMTSEIQSLPPGNYSVTITDGNGCEIENQFELTAPPPVELSIISVTNPTMVGEFGSAEIQITGGTAPYSIVWENGEIGPIATQLGIGFTDVVVTDANGCISLLTVEISITAFNVNFDIDNNICFGDCLGEIQLDISGGLPPYSIAWSDGQTDLVAMNLCDGIYSVTITDGLGASVEIPELSMISPPPLVLASESHDPTCISNNDGQITIDPSGGTPPYSYSWNTGSSQASQMNLTPGQYTITVTDDFGCQAEEVYELFRIEPLNVNLSSSNIDCESLTGTIYIIGENPNDYTYLINGGVATLNGDQAIDGLMEGEYIIEYEINTNCRVEIDNVQIETLSDFDIIVDPESAKINNGESLEIALTIQGQIGNYTVKWFTETAFECIQEDSLGQCIAIRFTPPANEIVTVNVIDEFLCMQESIIEILVNRDGNIYVPNVFTPNGDFINDVFKPSSSDPLSTISRFQIFSRWGENMYSERDVNLNAMNGWDGKFNGQVVSPGVYVYSIEVAHADGTQEVLSGDVTVIR